ncbi:hypothetical protein [Saccharopolyspora spinosa]|uniref:hypothetical protein n=1 Tax=Saccharopolyspora spinosa TaxID=60894 RepID=UPI00376F159D
MNELAERARSWLQDTYGPRVVLRGEEAILSTERAAFFGCGYVESDEPMLAATICVPLDGAEPFPASNAGPLDESLNVLGSAPGSWRWRVNAGNCVVATDAAVDGLRRRCRGIRLVRCRVGGIGCWRRISRMRRW